MFRGLWARLLAAFLVGAVAGAASVVAWSGREVESLRLERQRLELDLSDLQKRLGSQPGNDVWWGPVVGDVKVLINGVDQAAALEVERATREMTAQLVGRRVADVNELLLYNLLHQRLVEIRGTIYRLRLRLLVIGETVKIYLDVGTVVPAAAYRHSCPSGQAWQRGS